MSRLAKKNIPIPEGITAEIKDRDISFKGPKGEFSVPLLRGTEVKADNGEINVSQQEGSKQASANVGTTWALIKNAMEGVREGFFKILELEGVGFRAAQEGTTLVLSLGFANPIRYEAPAGIDIKVEKNVITVSGIDKALVGQVAATIRGFKEPEPYKGKGIRYKGEVIVRKVGKKAGTAE